MAGAYAYVIRRVHIADARRCAGGATRWSMWSSNATGAGSGPGPREPERSGQLKNNRIRAPPTPATDRQLPTQAVGRFLVSARLGGESSYAKPLAAHATAVIVNGGSGAASCAT